MNTSGKRPEHRARVLAYSKPVDLWLDATISALVVEMAHGERLIIDLTPEEFEERKQNGMRVYDGRKDGPETDD